MSNRVWRKYYYPQNGGGGGGGGGSPVYNAAQFVARAELAFQQLTCYVSGGWGQPLNAANKARLINKNSFNYTYRNIINAQTANTFAFDCVCLFVKGYFVGLERGRKRPERRRRIRIERCTGHRRKYHDKPLHRRFHKLFQYRTRRNALA